MTMVSIEDGVKLLEMKREQHCDIAPMIYVSSTAGIKSAAGEILCFFMCLCWKRAYGK